MTHKDFAVFILTHGRADRVQTYNLLRDNGYTGKIYIIIDNEDDQEAEYKKRYGDQVIVFDKAEAAKNIDIGDNFKKRNVVIFARNQCHRIAGELGLTHFLELDDDYDMIGFRYEDDGVLKHKEINNLDKVFDTVLDFLDTSNAITVCFAQGGDFIGGTQSKVWKENITRKAMNTFFCRTDRPFQFYGRINEDTTMYCILGTQGKLCFTIANVMIDQGVTQANAGGLTEFYLEVGTYVKSFYSVMYVPSAVKVATMGARFRRMHHRISWNNVCPKIVDEKYKKSKGGDLIGAN